MWHLSPRGLHEGDLEEVLLYGEQIYQERRKNSL